MEIETCINYLLTQAQIKVSQKFQENLSVCGVTPAQYLMLYYLWREDGLSPTQLAHLSGLDSSTITGLITRLERKGLIARVHNTDDRRSVSVTLTKDGADLKSITDPIISNSNTEVLSSFSEQERTMLEKALVRLVRL